MHAGTDTLLEPGENGVYYRVALHSSFDAPARTVRVAPEVTRLVYRSDRSSRFGMEASQVAYRNLIYTTDNDGNLNCLDARTLEIVWSRDIGDDSRRPQRVFSSTAATKLTIGPSMTRSPTSAKSTR